MPKLNVEPREIEVFPIKIEVNENVNIVFSLHKNDTELMGRKNILEIRVYGDYYTRRELNLKNKLLLKYFK